MSTVDLQAGDDRVTLDPAAGGRVTSAVLGGAERLVTAPPSVVPPHVAHFQWGVFVMAPWAGRIGHGELTWGGEVHRFPPAVDAHALHGVAHDADWEVVEEAADRVAMTCDLGEAGWPLGGHVRHEVSLAPGRLRCRLDLVAAEQAMPGWIGWHPCFRRPDTGDLRLTLDADAVLATEDMIPTGQRLPVDGDTDLRGGSPLGARRLDDAFVDVRSPARLEWPDLDLTIAFDDAVTAVVVFTPDHEVGVEPQTGWPDALALADRGVAGTGVARLAPGQALSTTMTWRWEAAGQIRP